MPHDDEFVSVLKTTDPRLVDELVATFEAEGIPYQHPGKNHAGLIPGLAYLEIDVRVPKANADDARALAEQLTARNPAAATSIAYRVARTYSGVGVLLGFVVGVILINKGSLPSTEFLSTAVLGGATCAGFLLGKFVVRHSCSMPGCRAKVDAHASKCGNCGAELRGTISSAREHFSAVERAAGGASEERPS